MGQGPRLAGERTMARVIANGRNASWLRLVPHETPRGAARAAAAVIVIVGLGLALGACSKCDVPNLTAPRACHEGPAPQ